MSISDALFRQMKTTREEEMTQLTMMQAGDMRTYSGGTDTTGESIVQTRGRVAVWDAVIGGIEADRAKDAAKRLGMSAA